MSTATLSLIRIQEPTAISFQEGVRNYIVVLSNSHKLCVSKDLVDGFQKQCLNCKQMVKLYKGPDGWVKFNLDGSKHFDLRKSHTLQGVGK